MIEPSPSNTIRKKVARRKASGGQGSIAVLVFARAVGSTEAEASNLNLKLWGWIEPDR
jgi:hypothetical protein